MELTREPTKAEWKIINSALEDIKRELLGGNQNE